MPESNVFCRDCMEAMREFPDGFFDLAVVDPPYGIGVGHKTGSGFQFGHIPFSADGRKAKYAEARELATDAMQLDVTKPRLSPDQRRAKAEGRPVPSGGIGWASVTYPAFDDSAPPGPEYFRELRRVAERQIIWGGNFFDGLGRASCWIVWDKKRRGLDQADCELAWTNLPGQSRVFEFRWNGMLQGDMANKEKRIHPTQKPVALYRWIFQLFAKPGDKILDTHLGSGSSRIAAWDAGLDFWGYEILPVFYELQQQRFEAHSAQVNLFLDSDDKGDDKS